ncbi:DUF2062 domain-containing protein [Rossellomorea aquimaris]|uniref:DUF2062 domain-containing protein n=1 Tax=Rossellomorea aquimaris TaxID=189382 RepID=A0A1J6W5Y8_9BACI|nr:hypothetical protein BHE18_05245 [Rossellomorea aquimaris]
MFKKYARTLKCLTLKLLRIKDNSHKISLGFTLGLMVNFVPSFGMGPVLSTLIAKIFKGNAYAGLVGGVFLIWAFPLCFYFNYLVGNLLIPVEVTHASTVVNAVHSVHQSAIEIGRAFIIGMLVNIIFFGMIVYKLVHTLLSRHRRSLLTFVHKNWNV